jgi:hypothetical protein
LKAHTAVAFFPNGKIDFAWLAVDHPIQDIPCSNGLVTFHPNGRIKSAELSKEKDFDGILLQGGTRIELDPEGMPVAYESQARLSKNDDSDQ